jgi:hypothetical protein
MRNHEEQEEASFKFVDRRRFDENGTERNSSEELSERVVSEPKTVVSEKKVEAPEHATTQLDFSLFIESLAHQAMMGLGMLPWPNDNIVRQDLRLAQEMIDILGLLQEKTKGNLDSQEAHILDSVLYQLRMAFVKLNHDPKDKPSGIIK